MGQYPFTYITMIQQGGSIEGLENLPPANIIPIPVPNPQPFYSPQITPFGFLPSQNINISTPSTPQRPMLFQSQPF